MDIINYVESLRKEKNITQEELAKQLGISRQTLIMIEKNGNISLTLAFEISKYFNKNIEEVFKLKEEIVMSKYDKLLEDIQAMFGKFTIVIKDNIIFRVNTKVSELGPDSLLNYELPNLGKMKKICIVDEKIYELIPTREYIGRSDRVIHTLRKIKSDLCWNLINFSVEQTWNFKNSKKWNEFMNNVE